MTSIFSVVLSVFLFGSFLTGCNTQPPQITDTVEEEINVNVVSPLPETIDINAIDNCTVAVELKEGDAYVDDNGKMLMDVTVYSYDLYDMVDIASLKENDVIVHRNEEVEVTSVKRLESGLVCINGGEGNGGFDLISNDSTVFYEVGPNDIKSYYELGKVTLVVSDEFEYIDESYIDSEPKTFYAGDFLTDDAGIEYNFMPHNTSIVIENGKVIKMNKAYTP